MCLLLVSYAVTPFARKGIDTSIIIEEINDNNNYNSVGIKVEKINKTACGTVV